MRYDAGAAAYDRFTGRWSRLYAVATLEAAGVKASDRVLDLATGTGDAALLALQHVGSYGTAVGVDLSLPMLRRSLSAIGPLMPRSAFSA